MAGIPDWAKPVELLEDDQDRINRIASPTSQPAVDLQIPEWARPIQQKVAPVAAPTPISSDIPEWAKPLESAPVMGTDVTPTETGLVGLPEGVEAYTYSENDLSTRSELYNPIYEYVEDRYGKQAVYGKAREDIVNTFLNNRRGNASGNSIRAVSEVDYLMDVKDDPARLLKAGKAYSIFENMESLTGEGVTWGEFGEGLKDYTASVILDPINFATMGIGKLFGGTAIRAGTKGVEKIAQREVSRQLMAGASREAAVKAGTEVLRKATVNAAAEGTAEVAQFAVAMQANKGVQRLMTKAGLQEVAAATVVDAAINAGTEFLYQRSLVDTNVQGEVSKSAIGIAALSAMAMGGIQAGIVVKRGMSDTALVSETVQQTDPKEIARELQESIREWASTAPADTTDWLAKVREGGELTDSDTDFFIDLLLGRTAETKAAPAVKVEQPTVRVSNPGGDWLDNKVLRAAESRGAAEPGTYNYNLGSGATTGTISSASLNPQALKDVAGSMGEEAFRESGEKLARLEASIAAEGYQPSTILIHVREDGTPFVVEGNHRLAEAIKSGRSSIDVEIQYRNGAEDADGLLKPGSLPLAKADEAAGDVEIPALKGLAQIMQEGGYFYTKRSEDDKMSNWIADFMKEDLEQADIDGIMNAFGEGLGVRIDSKITPEAFGDAFANKMNESARSMNSVMQVAKRLDVSLDDLNIDDFLQEALGLNLMDDIVLKADRFKGKGAITANVTETQNKFIRTLVSHPSTSMLNVLGYGSAAGLDVATDITMALFKGTRGTLKSLVGYADSGAKELYVAKQLLLSSKDRVKFAFDPDMTYAAYRSALEKNTGALNTLSRTLSGGVDISNSVEQMSRLGGLGGKVQDKADTVLNHVQTATFVNAQDAFTKSQEYVGQMNKMLRTKFGKSWNEFYTDPNASKIMATKEYKQLEMDAVAATMTNTFSKSYKDGTKLGELAGFIEDARNIPGLGFMIPFGRFFNNTIDFGIKNTPLLNFAAKATGKYADKSYEELAARGTVVTGLVWSLAQDEDENRRMGLGLYDEVIDGQVVSQQYDYPISLFKAAARVISYKMAGEEVPAEIIAQIGKDFGGGGLTRNLNKTTAEFADFGAAILAGELGDVMAEGQVIASDITAQALSGFLRPLEPIDTGIAIFVGVDQSPKDTAQGNKFVGDSLRYIDTTVDFFMGNEDAPLKMSAFAGEGAQQSSKNLGIRTQSMTNTQRVMNMLGLDQWAINSGLSKDKKLMIPEAVNEYQRQVYRAIEGWATLKMSNDAFRNSDIETQRTLWADHLKKVKQEAKFMLAADYDGPQSTLREQYDIMSKFSVSEVEDGLKALELDKTIGELSLAEVSILRSQLETSKYVDRMNISGDVYR